MATLLRKILEKRRFSPPPGILASITNPSVSNPSSAPLFPISSPIQRNPLLPSPPISGGACGGPPSSFQSFHRIYPSFPHCFGLDSLVAFSFDGSEAETGGDLPSSDEDGDRTAMWADSVKKKRKRKMNKHKLRKLRKRLRRQT